MSTALKSTARKGDSGAKTAQCKPARESGRHDAPQAAGLPRWLQAKLSVNQPGDAYEQEADRVAEQAMQQPVAADVSPAPLGIQRLGAPSSGQLDAAPASVADALASPGRPLEPMPRHDMERRFGQDFSQVHVHTDASAAESANAIDALAYTSGQDVVFGAGRYAPGTPSGDRLLAHELTHTLQQGSVSNTIQRALKFEIQTQNSVWAVKKTGAPDPRLLPRKYAPTTVGFKEGAGEERGDRPAYLSVGREGGPARRKGERVFVEAEGPLVTEEATAADAAKAAQVVREYRFETEVAEADIIDTSVRPGQLHLLDETDNAKVPAMAGTFNPNTFELNYSSADGTPLDVHLNKKGVFKKGHVKLVKVGHGGRPGIDKSKDAQFIEIWKITEDPSGPVDFLDKRAQVERVSVVDNAKDPAMKGEFNPNTWEKRYFLSSKFIGDLPDPWAAPEDVHMDVDGRLRPGHVKFMVREKLPKAREQTAIEVQSEHDGVLEFETPKWFRSRSDVKDRIQEAKDITDALNAEIGTDKEITNSKVVDKIKARMKDPVLGHIVEWPSELSTSRAEESAQGQPQAPGSDLGPGLAGADSGIGSRSPVRVRISDEGARRGSHQGHRDTKREQHLHDRLHGRQSCQTLAQRESFRQPQGLPAAHRELHHARPGAGELGDQVYVLLDVANRFRFHVQAAAQCRRASPVQDDGRRPVQVRRPPDLERARVADKHRADDTRAALDHAHAEHSLLLAAGGFRGKELWPRDLQVAPGHHEGKGFAFGRREGNQRRHGRQTRVDEAWRQGLQAGTVRGPRHHIAWRIYRPAR